MILTPKTEKNGMNCRILSFAIKRRRSESITWWYFSSISVLVYQNHFLLLSSLFGGGVNFYILKFFSIDQDRWTYG